MTIQRGKLISLKVFRFKFVVLKLVLLELFLLFLLTSCSKPRATWTRKVQVTEERSLLFATFGSVSLDASLSKPDLIWGQGSQLNSGLKLPRKEELILGSCKPPFGKIVTDYGNLTIKEKKNCNEQLVFEDVLISSTGGGKTPLGALKIPTGGSSYLVYDKIDALQNQKWFQFSTEKETNLKVNLKSDKILLGKLYKDGNRNRKMEPQELIDILEVEGNPQQLSTNLVKGEYFLGIIYDEESAEFELTFKVTALDLVEDKGGSAPNDAFYVDILADQTKLNDYVSPEDPIDFFSFTLKETSGLSIKLERNSGMGDADLTLYHDLNEDGLLSETEITGLSEGSGTEDVVVQNAPQGKWYLKVNQFTNSLAYTLTFRAKPSDSSDLDLQVKKVNDLLNVSIKNLGPNGADDVVLIITKNAPAEISSLEGPLKKIDDLHYSLNLNHIAAKDEVKVTLTGKSDELITLEVISKLKDPNPSNNATAILY
jgi:hypothetical protein